MRLIDILWLPPILLAVAIVLGTVGRTGFRQSVRAVRQTFVALSVGVVTVGIVIHLIARVFS